MNEKFLDLYRDLEAVMREFGHIYRDVEQAEEPDIQDKMRMCRNIRNFLSHNSSKTFIVATKEMCKFLEDLIKSYRDKQDLVSKHAVPFKTNSCKPSDRCDDVLKKMSSRGYTVYPVVDKDDVKLVSIHEVAKQVLESRTKQIKDIRKTTKDFVYVSESTLMDGIDKRSHKAVFVTANGKKGEIISRVLFL